MWQWLRKFPGKLFRELKRHWALYLVLLLLCVLRYSYDSVRRGPLRLSDEVLKQIQLSKIAENHERLLEHGYEVPKMDASSLLLFDDPEFEGDIVLMKIIPDEGYYCIKIMPVGWDDFHYWGYWMRSSISFGSIGGWNLKRTAVFVMGEDNVRFGMRDRNASGTADDIEAELISIMNIVS